MTEYDDPDMIRAPESGSIHIERLTMGRLEVTVSPEMMASGRLFSLDDVVQYATRIAELVVPDMWIMSAIDLLTPGKGFVRVVLVVEGA